MKISNFITKTTVAATLAGTLLFSAGCSDADYTRTGANDPMTPETVAQTETDMNQATGPDYYNRQSLEETSQDPMTATDRQMRDDNQEEQMASTPVPDYNFDDAKVAKMSYDELQSRVTNVQESLKETKDMADSEQEKEGLEMLSSRTENLSQELQNVDAEMASTAEPEMIRDVLEVEVEVNQFNENLEI